VVPIIPARFVDRPNRFLVTAELDDGREVVAHLPNTGRLENIVAPGGRLLLRKDGTPPRKTEYTATRAWDGCWVSLEASRAPRLLIEWLDAGNQLPGFGAVQEIRTEVAVAGHRLDLHVTTDLGPLWVEVKSGSRAAGAAGLLSKTPSTRGAAHLAALADLVDQGEPAAAVFVIQRPDARFLQAYGDADPGWIQAVADARAAGVHILAYGCDVTEGEVWIARELPIHWDA
jgi:sugar fermentation stimulation protein A